MSTPDPLIGTLTRALEAHNFADADTCACGVEYDGAMTYERHQAEVYLAAIAATGRLLPEGGERIDMFAAFMERPPAPPFASPDRTWRMRDSLGEACYTAKVWGRGAYAARCVATVWPDGCEHRTPWEVAP